MNIQASEWSDPKYPMEDMIHSLRIFRTPGTCARPTCPLCFAAPPKIRAILRSSRSLAHRFRDFDNAGEMADFRRHAAGHHPKSHQNKTMAWMEPIGLRWS